METLVPLAVSRILNPTVSAVVPAYNTAATLGEALDCLLAQTNRSWEALIVDDGSSDDTAAIAEAYCARGIQASARRGDLLRL